MGTVPPEGTGTLHRSGEAMDIRGARTGTALVVAAALIGGCESTSTHTPYADNPLLQARQPLLQPQAAASADASRMALANPRMVVVPPPGLYQPQQQQQPATNVAAAAPLRYNPAVPMNQPPAANAGPALPPMLARAEPAQT